LRTESDKALASFIIEQKKEMERKGTLDDPLKSLREIEEDLAATYSK
jgi:hypothetical protein